MLKTHVSAGSEGRRNKRWNRQTERGSNGTQMNEQACIKLYCSHARFISDDGPTSGCPAPASQPSHKPQPIGPQRTAFSDFHLFAVPALTLHTSSPNMPKSYANRQHAHHIACLSHYLDRCLLLDLPSNAGHSSPAGVLETCCTATGEGNQAQAAVERVCEADVMCESSHLSGAHESTNLTVVTVVQGGLQKQCHLTWTVLIR